MDQDRKTTTSLLVRACAGEAVADEQLTPLLYDELRVLARNLLRRERRDHTLQPTALVHEAWMRLIDEAELAHGSHEARARFLGIAANAMRRILIQHARGRAAQKRGGARQRLDLDAEQFALPSQGETLLDLDAALTRLQETRPDLVRLVELRMFAGLELREAAPILGLSPTRAKVHWALARALLSRLMQVDGGSAGASPV